MVRISVCDRLLSKHDSKFLFAMAISSARLSQHPQIFFSYRVANNEIMILSHRHSFHVKHDDIGGENAVPMDWRHLSICLGLVSLASQPSSQASQPAPVATMKFLKKKETTSFFLSFNFQTIKACIIITNNHSICTRILATETGPKQ